MIPKEVQEESIDKYEKLRDYYALSAEYMERFSEFPPNAFIFGHSVDDINRIMRGALSRGSPVSDEDFPELSDEGILT